MVFSRQFWRVLVRPSVLPFFILGLIDCGLTVYGTSRALGGPKATSLIVGLIVGAGVLITLLSTFDIWGSWHPVLRESPLMTQLLRGLWVVVFMYDWVTSMVGIYDLTGMNTERFSFSDGALTTINVNWAWLMRFLAVTVAGLVVCGSTLVVSFMAYNERREDVAEK
jgi:fatty acid desaturase